MTQRAGPLFAFELIGELSLSATPVRERPNGSDEMRHLSHHRALQIHPVHQTVAFFAYTRCHHTALHPGTHASLE
jgi:hypothetical protein